MQCQAKAEFGLVFPRNLGKNLRAHESDLLSEVRARFQSQVIISHTLIATHSHIVAIMAPANLPPIFSPTSQDIEMLLSAQCHMGSKNLQVHMDPYLWKTRPDGINVINIGKTW